MAATKIQSMFRASRTREQLELVKESAKYDDDDVFEYENIDIDAFLADVSEENDFLNDLENDDDDDIFVERGDIDSKQGTHDVSSSHELPPRNPPPLDLNRSSRCALRSCLRTRLYDRVSTFLHISREVPLIFQEDVS